MWPNEVNQIEYKSKADDSLQPAIFFKSSGSKKRPLLVGLHQWSSNYLHENDGASYAQWCIEHNWSFIYPDFRGPNNNPYATGSDFALKDIVSSVDFALNNTSVDKSRIYLVGVSGGGHASLLTAGRFPDLWTAVSVWVPISDIVSWYESCNSRNLRYATDIVASCGGVPIAGTRAYLQARNRSPLTYLKKTNLLIDINAGIYDGHTGSVPICHSIWAFNALADDKDKLTQEQIDIFTEQQQVPAELIEQIKDESYGDKKVLFRRQSGNARLTIFAGGHEIVCNAAMEWLTSQKKIRKSLRF